MGAWPDYIFPKWAAGRITDFQNRRLAGLQISEMAAWLDYIFPKWAPSRITDFRNGRLAGLQISKVGGWPHSTFSDFHAEEGM